MLSPFFYHPDDRPVFEKGKVIARYTYPGGAFEQHAGKPQIYWTETKTNGEVSYTFEEARRDAQHIFIHDYTRGFTIRIPVSGGQSALSNNKEKTWQRLYETSGPSAITDR